MPPKSGAIRKRKSKFINVQRHYGSCGPIAIANAIKWHGIETSYKAVLNWCLGVQAYHPKAGMWPFQMRYVLRTLRMNFKVRRKFTIEDLDALLAAGGACIFIYVTSKGGSHATFIDRALETGYRSWNRKKKMPPYFPREDMEATIRRSSKKAGGLYVYTFQPVKR